jgi:hypothetical protein
MTPDAKGALSRTIRSLRKRLLSDLHAATESAYRFSVRIPDAGLDAAARVRRSRFQRWIDEQSRAENLAGPGKGSRSADDFRREAEKQAAYTLLNRLVLLRLMESSGPSGAPLRSPAVLERGWESRGYADFRQLAPALARGEDTEGYAFLLRLVFEDLALDLPGLYGPAGIADLVPIPAATLRALVEALNAPELDSCWSDDMTLGWVYQYWNDPEREALDDKLHGGGKVEPHEIASKTQMFTERYMVDWLLQNSLGPLWMALCRKHSWIPEVEADGTLARLEQRRIEWRAKRASGEVALTGLLPLHTAAEARWAYWLPQPVPEEAVDAAPDSVRDLRLLDPAVGSGHFLVVALDLLLPLYREEARHRGESHLDRWSDRACVERILGHNLHGIDLDPRAVQIAAAALWLKARQMAPDARPERLNLVASHLRLASLPDNDPALIELRREVERETGIPAALTDTLVHALRGADHLGSLLKVDQAVDAALAQHESELSRAVPEQGGLFTGFSPQTPRAPIGRAQARASLLDRIESFLAHHTGGDDLGLRLRGEQLAAGVRFIRLVRESSYDLVVANPPYQGTSKMADSKYIEESYPLGKADLYAAFLLRGLELVRMGGLAAQVSMNGWMFLKQYSGLRAFVLDKHSIRSVVDLLWCAFEQMRHNTVAMYCLQRGAAASAESVGLVPTPRDEREESIPALMRKRAATLAHVGRHTFDPVALKVVPEWPLVYWWDAGMIHAYQSAPLIGDVAPATFGATTGNNARFVRSWPELPPSRVRPERSADWVPFINGAKGRAWLEELSEVIAWKTFGLAFRVFCETSSGANFRSPALHFRRGVAFSMIGANFSARVHHYPSVFGDKGSSVFPDDLAGAVCAMNSSRAREILESLNPSISFQVGDVNRLPLFPIAGAAEILGRVEAAFGVHESHREPSVEYRGPGPSPWRGVQEWAQSAVDRAEGTALPEYEEVLDPEPATDHLSHALGRALGRLGAEGVLDPGTADLGGALPSGLLFLDLTLDESDLRDGLGHGAAAPLHAAWAAHGGRLGTKRGLREWLALDFFKDVHKGMYENRPIHWPLSSPAKIFVAWVNIHRFTAQTLRVLLADHLVPTLARIEGELNDLRAARDGADRKTARAAERQFDRCLKGREDLVAFIALVEQCADRGAPPTDAKCPAREIDARYAPRLDDGVMVNSAALWPLLEPQWKEPAKWWKELATSDGRKDYDWSHLAMRYWPKRVEGKCRKDPSLGVAHGCFWRYHPGRAWAWELRLQDEIEPGFRIVESPYRPGGRDVDDAGDGPHREAWLRDHAEEALAAVEKEALRRMGRSRNRRVVTAMPLQESGLWTVHPGALWEMELRLSKAQGREVRITSPDESVARAAYEKANPGKVESRGDFMKGLVPPVELFETEEAAEGKMEEGEE